MLNEALKGSGNIGSGSFADCWVVGRLGGGIRESHGVNSGNVERSDEAVAETSSAPTVLTDEANGMFGAVRAAVGAAAVTAAKSSDDVDGMAIADPAGT